MEFLLLYSEIIPTILATAGISFILTGGLDENKTQLIVGVGLFAFAVAIPFILLSILI